MVWVVVAELLPPRVRAVSNAINICFSFVLGFVASKTFVDLTIAIGAALLINEYLKCLTIQNSRSKWNILALWRCLPCWRNIYIFIRS